MNVLIATLNQWGASFLHWAGAMFWQSSLLALVIFALDFGLSRRVRASVRHALWLILLVKLILPTSLALPTSPVWWWSRRATEATPFLAPVAPPADPTIADEIAPTPRFTPAISPSAPEPLPSLTPAAWILAVALAGSIGLLAWLLWRYTLVLRLCRLAGEAPALEAVVAEARELAGLDASVRIKISSGTTSPAVCGLFRPVILFPQSLVEILSPDQLRAVVLHESIHLGRGDVWVNCLQGLLQTVYWWHPLVWLANARMRRVREEAVDDAVMVALRTEADIYAPTLIAVARFALRRPLGSLGLVGILESRSALRQRIERLVNSPVPARAGLSFASVFGLALFSVTAVPMGSAPPPPPPPPSGPYETVSSEASLSVNRMNLSLSGALDLPTTDGSQVPWPDPNFNGYQSVNLRADFFILDESALRAKIPALANTHVPVAFGSDEVDELFTHLRQAGARFFNNYEEGIDVPGISGTRQHYHIGGLPRGTGTAEFATTNVGGHSMISGTEISLSASQPDWTPIDFTARPWQADDHTRCELKLGTGTSPGHFQSAEMAIPSGGALAWATTTSVKPGKCEVIFLMSWNTNDGLSSATFQHHQFPPAPGFQSFVGVLRQRHWRNPSESIWPGANDWGRQQEDLIYPLLHEAGLNWLPPRRLTFNFDSLEVYAPPKDVEVIQSLVGKINESTLDDEEKELKQVLAANPTNTWARRCLEMIQKSRGAGNTTSGQHRDEPSLSNTRLSSFLLNTTFGRRKFRALTGVTADSSPAEYLAGFGKLLPAYGASLPANSLWLGDKGLLTVRGTPRELAAVELLFQDLNTDRPTIPLPPPQRLPAAEPPARTESVAAGQKILDPATNLCMRAFRLNTNILEKTFAVMGGSPNVPDQSTNLIAHIGNVFKAMGVDLKPPKAWFYNDGTGILFIRATSGDLDAAARIVAYLNHFQTGPLDDRPFDTIQ